MAAASMDPLHAIRAALGTPAYDRHNVLLYEGDCIELMRRTPANVYDLTVTSPPYNIGKEYEAKRDVAEYVDWCAAWIAEVYRIAAADGAFWLNLGYLSVPNTARAIPIPYLLWDRVPFFLVQEVVWQYGAGVAAKLAYSPRNEKFLWYVRNKDAIYFNLDAVRDPNIKYPNQFKNGKRKVNLAGKNPGDVWSFPKVTSGRDRSSPERTPHPAQFPVAVIERIIKGCSRREALVLDPFMGSGTTAEVAMKLGRPVVGIERNPDYIEMATRRLDRAADNFAAEREQFSMSN
ncbi:MAG TPA: site-specific DNA-methyltransferase [Solirubrobacteraceae bacterium]|jgi:adenine-specific DNA-methyltransferase|nr:site-specific DNA-methyltransferase [Solirubrobacteraceae bacterium]